MRPVFGLSENLGERLIPERKNRLFSWFKKKGRRLTIEADTVFLILPSRSSEVS
jgi:hypothetical protein